MSDEKPPVFASWKGWYITLISGLAACVAVFYALTRHFS